MTDDDRIGGAERATERTTERAGVAPPRAATSRTVPALRAALLAFALIVVVQAALGFAGHLGAAVPVIGAALAIAAAVAAVVTARGSSAHDRDAGDRTVASSPGVAPTRAPWTAGDAAGISALAAALAERLWAGLHRDAFVYDVLSYHLHLPAAWRAAGRLRIVPTPFGDQAPAYAPSNAELVYHLALAATGNLRLGHTGQWAFAALAALAIVATVRGLGGSRGLGGAAALGFLLVPEVWQQASGAMADLALAAAWLACLPFLLRLERRRAWPDVVALGAALGLLLGTKYVAAVMMAPLVVWAVVAIGRRGPGARRPAAFAAVAALTVACGGFWYVRNLIATGDPTFPVTFPVTPRLGPFTLARGLYDGAAMRAWTYHLPLADVHALLEMFTDTGWGFLISIVAAAVLARRTRWPALALALGALGWLVVPYQQSRFFFPLWGAGAVMVAVAARTLPPRGQLGLLALGTLGAVAEFPTPGRLAVILAAAGGAAVHAGLRASWRAGARRSAGAVRPWRRAVAAAAGIALLGGGLAWARARRDGPAYAIGDDHDQAWAFMRDHARDPGAGHRIAYAGSNLPLPLWGWNLENDVRYVNVSGRPDDVLHDFARASPPRSSTPSAEPAPERAHPDRAAWLANLAARRIDVLFVASLYPLVRASMAHDADGFPIERTWADTLPDRFSLRFANAGVRIYGYHPAPNPRVSP